MIRCFLVTLALVVAAGCSSLKVDQQFASREVLASCNEACVEVLVNGMIKGTGSFISADGLVVTASHLFDNDEVKVEVISTKYGRLSAKLLRRNRVADVALVKVDVGQVAVPVLKLAEKIPEQGEYVGCFGAALWNPIMLLNGRVANPNDNYCEYAASHGYLRCFFVSAAIPGLASGGPWINSRGELVGVQAGHLLDQGKDAGIAMVGGLNDIKALLKADGSIRTAGIAAWVWPLWTTDKAIIDRYPVGTEGLIVNTIHAQSPFNKAGIKAHELIVACEGVKTVRRIDLLKVVKEKKPSDIVTMDILELDGKIRKVEVKLANTEPGTL